MVAFVFLVPLFITLNLMSQESIQQKSVKTIANNRSETLQLFPELFQFPNQELFKRHQQTNSFETLLDSSESFVFETNYDSVSYNKCKYEYNEDGLRISWMFYRRVDNDPDKEWYLNFYFTYEYDDDNNMILQFIWNGYLDAFHQVEKRIANYNDLNQKIKSEGYKRSWNEEIWHLNEESFFEYDSIGNLSFHENWGNYGGVYVPLHQRYYKYDSLNNLTQIHFYLWDRQNSEWKDLYKLNYDYDENQNRVLYTVTKWSSYLGIWWDETKEEMDYDENNKQIKRAFYERDSDTSDWQQLKNFDLTYDQDSYLREFVESRWMEDSARLVNFYRHDYSYDENGYLKESLNYFWIIDTVIPSYWDLGSKGFYVTDSSGNVLVNGSSHWDASSEDWLIQSKEYMYYSGFTLGHPEKFISDYKLYPNPTAGVLRIKSQLTSIERIEIYSLQSKLLFRKEIHSDEGVVDISNQKSGIYLLHITFKNGRSNTARIVKL
jgi:hypothetical protein